MEIWNANSCVFHMALPELRALLSGDELLDIRLLPVLRVTRSVEEAAGFTARPGRFSREDGFFEDGDVHRHLYIQDVLTGVGEVETRCRVSEFPCPVPNCTQRFDSLESYEHHYNTRHRNVCSACKRTFPSVRLLDIHLLEWHDSLFKVMAEKTNMFQCLVDGCPEKFKTSGERKKHLVTSHLYPRDFRFDKPKRERGKINQECSKVTSPSMDITAESSVVMESMEISAPTTGDGRPAGATTSSLPRYKPSVPSTICFGHGSVRGFRHARKKK